jgi:hypothetical protein
MSIIVSMYRMDEITSPVDDKNECNVKKSKNVKRPESWS